MTFTIRYELFDFLRFTPVFPAGFRHKMIGFRQGGRSLYGLEAISAHNGWAMAVVGATIVFTGLVILSFAISQIHRILSFRETRSTEPPSVEETGPEENLQTPVPPDIINNINELACFYQP